MISFCDLENCSGRLGLHLPRSSLPLSMLAYKDVGSLLPDQALKTWLLYCDGAVMKNLFKIIVVFLSDVGYAVDFVDFCLVFLF